MIRMKYFMVSFLFLALAFGQDEYFEEVLAGNHLDFGQFFGVSIATSSEDLIISSTNQLHFFHWIEDGFEEYQVINAPVPWMGFGNQIQLTEEFVLYVGSTGENVIYQYLKEDGLWVLHDTIYPGETDVSLFGKNFYFNSGLGLISSKTLSNDSDWDYVVFLYENVGGCWQQVDRIDGTDNGFGSALYIDTELMLIGDHTSGTTLSSSGAVHIYNHLDDMWQEEPLILPSLPVVGGGFGDKIIREGNWFFISSPGTVGSNPYDDEYPGLVYTYLYDESGISEVIVLGSSDGEAYDGFGNSLAVIGSTLVVSAPERDDAGTGSGSVYIFKLTEEDIWQEFKKIIPSDLDAADMFGGAVAITNEFVFGSSPLKNNLTGAVYAYDPNDLSLHSNFAADVRNGEGPLTVQFTSVPQGDVTAYEWDFNSDGYIDSTEPHPEFTYEINGIYDVTLTVHDDEGSDSQTKDDYIQVVSDVLFGDVNVDGVLDVLDLVTYINIILGYEEPAEQQFLSGDVNFSGAIDILDVVLVVDEILGTG